MWKITIVSIGKIKEKYYEQALNEYLKRLRPWAKIELIELSAESFSDHQQAAAKKIESTRLEQFLIKRNDSQVFLLDENGEELSSPELAMKLEKISAPLVFVIAGSLGFEKKLLDKYPKISLSRLTFLHEMAKVILVEQIYRALSIIKGKSYHH